MSPKKLFVSLLLLLSLTGLLTLISPTARRLQAVAAGPTLQIGTVPAVAEGEAVTVPLAFTSQGTAIAAMVFSLDFDESCLALNPRDANSDGRPDAITVALPPGLFASISVDPTDRDGEVDVIIADYFPPFVVLADSAALLTLTFETICVPPAGSARTAAITFASEPMPSFGTTTGQSVSGTNIGGAVTILSTRPAPTTTPTVTATPTLIPTAPPMTPSATPTLIPTAPPMTVVDHFTATSYATTIHLHWQTSQEVNTKRFFIHRLPLGQSGEFEALPVAAASQGNQGGAYILIDTQVAPGSQYTYLLIEEKHNGRFVPYYDLLLMAAPLTPDSSTQLLPLIMR